MCEPVADQQLDPPREPEPRDSIKYAVTVLQHAELAGTKLREDKKLTYDEELVWDSTCEVLRRLIELAENK